MRFWPSFVVVGGLLLYLLTPAHAIAPAPQGWTKVRRAPALAPVTVYLHTPANQSLIDATSGQIHAPCSPQYGHYLSKEEAIQLLQGSPSGPTLVQRWLENANATFHASTLSVRTNVAEASRLFSATFHEYENGHGDRVAHSDSFTVPVSLQPHVAVLDTREHRLMRRHTHSERRSTTSLEARDVVDPDSCASDPGCLRELYGTASYVPQVPDQIRVGTANFNGEIAMEKDLVAYMQQYRPDAVNVTLPLVPIDEHANHTLPALGHAEATLDVELFASQVWPIQISMYFASGKPPIKDGMHKLGDDNEPFLHLFEYLLHLDDDVLPSVLSISYADFERTIPRQYAERACQYAAVLGMRGMTIVASSGDEGLGSLRHDGCETDGEHKQFMPMFPASCPYVTAVGGTDSMVEETVGKVPGKFMSGAGFSELFDRPAWQDDAVQSYLDNTVKDSFAGLFQAGGRAYPDVAVRSVSFMELLHGHNMTSSGTSGAAPLFASVVALLNDARVAAGQPLLGFFNPLLYGQLGSLPGAFMDVADGTTSSCGVTGFQAAPGWDVASGYGSPLFQALRPAVLTTAELCAPPPSPPPPPSQSPP